MNFSSVGNKIENLSYTNPTFINTVYIFSVIKN